jgi:hypothetical protein
MKCPHCTVHFHDNLRVGWFLRQGNDILKDNYGDEGHYFWEYRSAVCPACKEVTLQIVQTDGNHNPVGDWSQIHPIGANRGPVPPEVPADIPQDYIEACNVLPISAKASAALARRCLQNMLHAHNYRDRDRAREIVLLLNEADPKKALPHRLRETIDGIRNFGNFSAHPIDDKTTLQVIDVDPHEAEWCLETIEELFEHFYVGPAMARAKKAALDAKLAAAGKPPSKC